MNKYLQYIKTFWYSHKEFRTVCYLLVYGLFTMLGQELQNDLHLSVIFGATMDYLIYKLSKKIEELEK